MPPLGYRRATGILERLRDAPALRAVAGEPGVWVVGGAVRDTLLGASRASSTWWWRATPPPWPAARPRASAASSSCTSASARPPCGRARWCSTWPPRGASATPRRARCPRWSSGRRSRRTSPGATSRSTRSRWPWPTAPWPRSHTPRRTSGRVVLRVLHDASFADDPTRLLRLARYAARLGFAPEPHTAALAAAAGSTASAASAWGRSCGCSSTSRSPPRWRPWPGTRPRSCPDWTPIRTGSRPRSRPRRPTRGATCSRSPRPGPRRRAAAGARVPGRRPADPPRLRARRARSARRSTPRPLPSAGGVLRREPVEVAVLAGGERARRWIAEWRHARAAVSGVDLLAAGLRGPEIGAGLDAATDAQLDGRAPDREAQLAAALAHVQRHPRHHEADAEHLERRGDLREDDHPDHGRRGGEERDEQGVGRAGQLRHRELVAHVGDDRRGDADADPGGDRDGVVERGDGVPERERRDRDQRGQHRGGEAVEPLPCATRCPSTM